MNFTLGSSSLATRPARASIVRTPIPGKHGCHAHNFTGCRRIYLLAVADVDADVADARFIRIREKDQVAGLRIADGDSCVELIDRDARQVNTRCGAGLGLLWVAWSMWRRPKRTDLW